MTDKDGNTATATHVLHAFPSLLRPPITFPQPEQILTTTTPTLTWNPVPSEQSVRVRILHADMYQSSGDSLYISPYLPGTTTTFALPAGVLEPGRRYVLPVEAFDTPDSFASANIRADTYPPFSVAGPKVSLFLTQSSFHTGDTLKLGARIRNDGAPVKVRVHLWAGVPTMPEPVEVANVEVTLPSTSPDVSLVATDLVPLTFTSAFPPVRMFSAYDLRLRKLMGSWPNRW